MGLGNDDHRAVAARLGDDRQPDAGVAGRPLDDDAAGLQKPALLGVADDEQRRAVLHRLAGIEELSLAEDGASGFLGRAFELDQRRVADRIDD